MVNDLLYILTVLLPINGLFFLGIYRERQRIRRMLLANWQRNSRRK